MPLFSKKYYILFILVFAAILSLSSVHQYMWTGGDNAHYMILAKSIISGNGYSDILEPGNPPHTKFPFMFPLILAPFVGIFGFNIILLNLVVVGFFLGSVYLSYLFFRKYDEKLALLISFLTATSYYALTYSVKTMSEIPALFFSLLALICLDRYLKEKSFFNKSFVFVFLAVTAAYFARSIGIALIGAVLIFVFVKEIVGREVFSSYKGLMLLTLIIPVGAWMWRNSAVQVGESYVSQFLMKSVYAFDAGRATIGDLAGRAFDSFHYYIGMVSGIIFPNISYLQKAFVFSTFMLFAIFVFGGVYLLLTKFDLVSLYVCLTFCILLVWPWKDARFLVPIIPLMFYVFIKGAETIMLLAEGLLKRKVLDYILVGFLVLISISVLMKGFDVVSEEQRAKKLGVAADGKEFENFFAAAQWAKANTPPNSVFIARKPTLFYIWANDDSSDRKSLIYPYTTDSEKVMGMITERGVDYVVIDEVSGGTTPAYLIPAIEKYKDKFTTVWSQGNTYVLKRAK